MTGDSEAARIQREYERRARVIPAGFYGLDKPANIFAHSQIAARSLSLLEEHGLLPLESRKIADIGCGTGDWLLEFIQWGAAPENLFGIDLNSARIERARQRVPHASLQAGDASALPLANHSVDIACQFTAFSSVLDEFMRRMMAAEMLRIVKPDGAILWYDLRVNNPANPAVRGIRPRELQSLFPGCRFAVERITLAPPLARALVPRFPIGASLLQHIPLLRSHHLALIRKGA